MAYCFPCNKRATRREGVGPTGRKGWMMLLHIVTKTPEKNCVGTMNVADMEVAIRMIAKIILKDEV